MEPETTIVFPSLSLTKKATHFPGMPRYEPKDVGSFVTGLSKSLDGESISAVGSNPQPALYSSDMTLIGFLQGHSGDVTDVAFSDTDPNLFVTTSLDRVPHVPLIFP